MSEEQKSLDFEAMIVAKTRELANQYDADNEPRIRQAVTMEKRWRGDYFGTFNNRRNYRFEYVGQLGKGLVTFPVVPRAIRSKTSTSLATEVKIDCQPARNLPEIEAGADLAQNIIKRFESVVWDEDFELHSAHLRQTQRLCYARLSVNPRKGIKYQEQEQSGELKEIEVYGATFACANCGLEMQESDYDGSGKCPDPECGGTQIAKIADGAIDQISPLRTVDRRTGEPEAEIISALLTRCDDVSGVGLQFDRCRWFNYNKLIPRYELEQQFPRRKKDLGTPDFEKWSPGTHWWYAMTKEDGNYFYAGGLAETYKKGLKSYHEAQYWYFSPEQCHGWKSEGVWTLEASDGDEPDFTFEHDETIEDAVIRNYGLDEFTGVCVLICNGKVLSIEPCEFSEEFWPIGWQINPTSFFPLGEERLLNLQDAITNVLSMVYSAGLKRQLAPLIYNSMFIEEDELRKNHTGGFVAVKQESGQALENVNWQNQIFYLNPPPLDALVWELAELIIQIQKEESGVYDEVVGNVNAANVTKGGRELAANQGLAQMLAPSKAKRRAKIDILKRYLRLWQQLPDQAYQMVKGTMNEEWKSSDIAAFKNLDLDSDVLFFVVEGTDIPRATPDTQSKLMMVYQLGLLAPGNPLPVDFTVKLLRALGVEYDVANSDASRRLAAKRLKLLKDKIAQNNLDPSNAFVVIEEPAGQPDPVTGEQATIARRVLNPELLMQIMSDTRLQARESENHQVQMDFYGDHINGELGREQPNEVLLELLDQMARQHLGVLNNLQAREAATQGQIAGTNRAVSEETHRTLTGADEREAAMMEQQAAQSDAAAQQSAEGEAARLAFEADQKNADRKHDLRKHVLALHAKKNKRDDYQ